MPVALLGLDVGTSSLKAALFSTAGQMLARAAYSYPTYTPQRGWAEQEPEDWFAAAAHCIREILASPGAASMDIAGIGIAGQSWAAVPVDNTGKALCRTPLWMDTRAQPQCDQANRTIGSERIFAAAMNLLQPSYTLPKLLWYRAHQPHVLTRAAKVLQSNGFIVHRLTGAYTQDLSQGYGYAFFGARTLTWDHDLRRAFDIPECLLPDLMPCHAIAGRVTEEAARLTGLPAGTPVVAGGLDAACGTFGAGVVADGQTQEQGGQAGGMSVCLPEPLCDPRLILSAHVVPGKWLLQGGTVGGGALKWLGQVFALGEKRAMPTFDEMNSLAAAVPAGSEGLVLLPYLAGERSPVWDPDAVGVFYGLDYRKTGAHLIRAAMEGAALALRHNLDAAAQTGAKVTSLHAVGGAAQSPVWTQIKADITGHPLLVMPDTEHTALGAAMLAGLGTGVYADARHAVHACVGAAHTVTPDASSRAVYDRAYGTYRSLYDRLKPLMRETAQAAGD